MAINPISKYLKEIEKLRKSGQATELSYRPAFAEFITSFSTKIDITHEPKREKIRGT